MPASALAADNQARSNLGNINVDNQIFAAYELHSSVVDGSRRVLTIKRAGPGARGDR